LHRWGHFYFALTRSFRGVDNAIEWDYIVLDTSDQSLCAGIEDELPDGVEIALFRLAENRHVRGGDALHGRLAVERLGRERVPKIVVVAALQIDAEVPINSDDEIEFLRNLTAGDYFPAENSGDAK
jgi:hypothetical protein